ncbi:unnamed protein product, partial [Rotaria sp. Silwood2]
MAGFSYTGAGDTVRCEKCQLEVSGWTQDMVPKVVHADRNPNCPFVCSALVNPCMESNDQENPTKCQKIESNSDQCKYNCKLWEWKADTDDPSEVHKTLSPTCPYVLSTLIQPEQSSPVILNEISTNNRNNQIFGSTNAAQLQFDQIVNTTPYNPAYSEITKRLQSFTTWSYKSSPSVDELVRAGFFYTGAENIVTCFYCNGSFQNWNAN